MASKKRRTWRRRFFGVSNESPWVEGGAGFRFETKGLDVNHEGFHQKKKRGFFLEVFGPEIRRMTSKLMICVILSIKNLTLDQKESYLLLMQRYITVRYCSPKGRTQESIRELSRLGPIFMGTVFSPINYPRLLPGLSSQIQAFCPTEHVAI